MNYIKDNGIMEKLPFWKFGGKSSSAEKYLFENENGSGQMLLYCLKMKTAAGRYCFIMYCRGLSWQ